jgi:outer membrane protein, multidrug efflux system
VPTILTLVSDVSNAYLELLELAQEETIAERTLASRRATLDLARSRLESGVISTLVGRMPFHIPATADLARVVEAIRVPDSLPATLLARRPDVREAERGYAASVARIGVAQASRFPTISINGYCGTQSNTLDNLFISQTEVYRLQAGVSLPIFTGGRLKNQSRAAGARAEQARLQFEQTVLQAFREASDALVAVRTARDQRVAQQSQVVALRRRRSWPTSATRAGSRGTSRCSTPNGSSSRRSWG